METKELQHAGIKGMKWGIRRYQNKDGTLTPAGKKRYNREMEKLKAEKKVLQNRQRTQAKLDKLDAMKKEVNSMKRGEKVDPEETVQQKKDRILKSRSASQLYKNAHLFDDDELQKAYNRLNTEKNIRDLAPKEVDKGKDLMDKCGAWTKSMKEVTGNSIELYNNVAKVYNSVPSLNNGKQAPVVK